MPLQEPLSLRRAALCWRFDSESEQPVQQVAIRDADLAVLLNDLNHNRTRREATEQECVGPGAAHYWLAGVNAWGDRVSLDGYCGAFAISGNDSEVWRPNSMSQGILDRLLTKHPKVIAAPDERTAPEQLVAIWADLVNDGDRARAATLWSDPPAIPPGVRIELKVGEVRSVQAAPGTPQATYQELVEVSSLYRRVPADGTKTEYEEVRFTLGRDRADVPWRILGMRQG
jgi:hypothetical protein